ncbi:hypothetical protein GQX73_g6457 [Xylaria multiplex]|uniref:Uncharacterized protein n=1 Tax=Xylaria multiplex TaxID=323545 RepID=A0A7C8MKK5_9PEZI|nr:hypothetical protein GQX73_g6457 [Xylaria multiplex]
MPVNAAGRTVWNDRARSDLLQAIIDVAPPNAKEWEAIIALLRPKGYTYGYNAALQHLQKLKKKDGGEAGNTSAPTTPNKPKPGGKKTPNGKKRKANAQNPEGDDDEKKIEKKFKHEVGAFNKYVDEEPDLNDDGEI